MTAARPKHQKESKISKEMLAATLRQVEAVKLRVNGWNFEDIATKLGYKNRSAAYQAVLSYLNKKCSEPAEELRNMELLRLDALLKLMWKKVEGGSVEAGYIILKIMERRSKYLGLDQQFAPQFLQKKAEQLAQATGTEASDIMAEVKEILAEAKKNNEFETSAVESRGSMRS